MAVHQYIGGPELFKCNYDIGHLNLSKCLPAFYHEIIPFWQDLIASNPKSKNDVLEQIVWNNKFIKSDKKSIYLQHWRYAGILKINDLFDTQQNCFPSFDSFRVLGLRNQYLVDLVYLKSAYSLKYV